MPALRITDVVSAFTDEREIGVGSRVRIKPWAILVAGREDPGIGVVERSEEMFGQRWLVLFGAEEIWAKPEALEIAPTVP